MNWKLPSLVIVVLVALGLSLQLTGFTIAERTVRIGYIPLAMSVPVYITEANNYFEEAGVKYELVKMGSSAELAEALGKGQQIDATFEAMTTSLLKEESRNPGTIKVFALSSLTADAPFDSLIVSRDSPVGNLYGLENTKIGVPFGSIFTATLEKFLKDNTVNAKTVKFVPLAVADQVSALNNGVVDAVYTLEPSTSTLVNKYKARRLHNSVSASLTNNAPFGAAALSASFAAEHPELAKKVLAVYDKSVDFARSNSQQTRDILSHRLNIDEGVSQSMVIFNMLKSAEFDKGKLQEYITLLLELKELENNNIDLNSMVYSTPH